MFVGRRRKAKLLSAFEKHPVGTPLVLLITLGVVLADQYNYEQPTFSPIEIIALLFIMNILLFMLLGLHHALKRTMKVKYWTFGQKCKFTLYLFITLTMFTPNNIIGGLIFLSFFFVLIYFVVRRIWDWYKNTNSLIKSSKQPKVNIVAIEEIDRMDGRQFELFLSKLYDGLGYLNLTVYKTSFLSCF
jgi:hypothetical protein